MTNDMIHNKLRCEAHRSELVALSPVLPIEMLEGFVPMGYSLAFSGIRRNNF